MSRCVKLALCLIFMGIFAANSLAEGPVVNVVGESDAKIAIDEIDDSPVDDDWLFESIALIPNQEQGFEDLVRCFFVLSVIQESHAGGINRSDLNELLEYVKCDESMIVDGDEIVSLRLSEDGEVTDVGLEKSLKVSFSEYVFMSFQYDESDGETEPVFTHGKIGVYVPNSFLHANIPIDIAVDF